ncbi:MAG: TrbI/VirB10 family protein [Ferrimonas sp.]
MARNEERFTPPPPPVTNPQYLMPTPQTPTLEQQRAQAREQQLADFRQQQLMAAMRANTQVPINTQVVKEMEQTTSEIADLQRKLIDHAAASMSGQLDASLGFQQMSHQDQNLQFASTNRPVGYLQYDVQNPIAVANELRAGTMIPAVLMTGINSDLPNSIVATVSRNIFDSVTGKNVLIPQGSKLFGTYSSRIVFGQSRVLIAWDRLNLPNGQTLHLDSMAGVDTAGYSGFADQVDRKTWQIFGNALMLGMISGLAQVGVNETGSETADAVADGVTQQFAQAGASLLEKNLDVQPTITVRTGYRFNVLVNKDVILPTWGTAL